MKRTDIFVACALTLLFTPSAKAVVTFDWATVANPGNEPDPDTGFGSVAYTYRISKHEVTNAQYVEFLNSVARIDDFALYDSSMATDTVGGIVRTTTPGGFHYSVKEDAIGKGPGGEDGEDYAYGSKPVVHVGFWDALRFVNWLHNGQPTAPAGPGTTEDGAYNLSEGTAVTRQSNASIFLPGEDEWYKAAYYDPTGKYYLWSNSSDIAPDNNLPSMDSGNSANLRVPFPSRYTTGDPNYPLTDVGAYELSTSPYGTFDQTGNVQEWSDSVVDAAPTSGGRLGRGGPWVLTAQGTNKYFRAGVRPSVSNNLVGFRVAAAIPEPSAVVLSIVACATHVLFGSTRKMCK